MIVHALWIYAAGALLWLLLIGAALDRLDGKQVVTGLVLTPIWPLLLPVMVGYAVWG